MCQFREVYLQNTASLHGVVHEKGGGEIDVVAGFVIVSTSVHFLPIAGAHAEVVWYVDAVTVQLSLQHLVQLSKVDTVGQRSVAGRVEDAVDDLFHQILLCGVAHGHDFLQGALAVGCTTHFLGEVFVRQVGAGRSLSRREHAAVFGGHLVGALNHRRVCADKYRVVCGGNSVHGIRPLLQVALRFCQFQLVGFLRQASADRFVKVFMA